MKAMIMKEYMKLEYTDVPLPEMGEKEVLVQVKAAAVCGSDLHGMNGVTRRRQVPIIMGHEASGIIERTGAEVSGYKAGDRVTFDSTIYCGSCKYCLSGQINLCDNRQVLGVSCDDYRRHGTYAEYVSVPEHVLYKLDDAISFQDAALVEPMSVALHAIRLLPLSDSDSVVLFGTGTIALFALQFLKLQNLNLQLIVVGRNGKKLSLAKNLGATAIINSSTSDVHKEIMALTEGRGADCSFDGAGAENTFQEGLACLRKGGTFVTIANLKTQYPIDMAALITRELTAKGSCASSGEYLEILGLLALGKLRTDYVISKELPLSEGPDFMLKLYNKEIEDFYKLILIP